MNIDEAKVSIIIPVYNKEKYIGKTLESVVNQSFKNYEVIVINDGSTDNSLSIIEEYSKRYSQIQVHTIPNGGVSNARNIGLKYAKGEWIQFLDGDDYIECETYSDIFGILDKYSPDILFSNIKKVDEYGNIIIEEKFPLNGYIDDMKKFYDKFCLIQEQTGLYGCVSNKIIKKNIIEKYNFQFNVEITLAEDFEFFLNLYNVIKDCYYYPYSYLNYLQNAENSSTQSQLIKNPNYLIQANIFYKEYKLLKNKKIKDLSMLKNRITKFILLYLKNNYIEDSQTYNLDNLLQLEYLDMLEVYRQNLFDKILLHCLHNNKRYMLERVLSTYQFCKLVVHKIKRGK